MNCYSECHVLNLHVKFMFDFPIELQNSPHSNSSFGDNSGMLRIWEVKSSGLDILQSRVTKGENSGFFGHG